MGHIDYCYNCGCLLDFSNKSREHIPADCLFTGFDSSYKTNRITVAACKSCNHFFSTIDQEIRDAIAVRNYDHTNGPELLRKGIKNILRSSSWKNRVNIDADLASVDFDYEKLRSLHIKNFKGLFVDKYGKVLSEDYFIDIISVGDEELQYLAEAFDDYLKTGSIQVSGHKDVFQYILMDISIDEEKGVFFESGDLKRAVGFVAKLVYYDDITAFVFCGTKDFIQSC